MFDESEGDSEPELATEKKKETVRYAVSIICKKKFLTNFVLIFKKQKIQGPVETRNYSMRATRLSSDGSTDSRSGYKITEYRRLE